MNTDTWSEKQGNLLFFGIVTVSFSVLAGFIFLSVSYFYSHRAERVSMRQKSIEACKTSFPGSYPGYVDEGTKEFTCYKDVKEAKIVLGKMVLK